jgi:PAS domain S-box-containing protein
MSDSSVKGKSMALRIRAILAPPEFPDDEDKTRLANVLNTLLLSGLVFLAFFGLIGIPFIFAEKLLNSILALVFLVNSGVAYYLMRHGQVRAAGALFVTGLWLVFTVFLPFAGGMTSVAVVFYVVGTVAAGLLLGTSGALIYIAACGLAGLGMIFLEASAHPLPRLFPVSPIVGWVDMLIALVSTLIVLRLTLNGLREALSLTRQRLEERRQTEQALRESEEKFRILFETSRDFIFVTNIEGKIVNVNRTASKISGYSENELKQLNIQDLYFDRNERDRIIKEVDELGFIENREIKGKSKDGTIINGLLNVTVIKDNLGNVVGFQGSVKDISERKLAEDALRESEERFFSLSMATSEGIGISDQGRIVDANPQLAGMLGYEPEELIGLNASDFVAPESRDLVMANELAEVEGPYEHLAIKKDGTIFPVEIRARTISYKGRETRVAIIRDITERKEVENALRESEAQFRHLWGATIEGIVIHDQGTILEANDPACLLFGFPHDQAIGKNVLEFAPAETRDRLREHFLSESSEPFETFYTLPGDRKLILELFPRQILYQGKPARMVAIRDITQRKHAEDYLSQQIERLGALHTIEQAVTSSMDLKTILELLVREIVEQLQVDATSVLLLNPQNQTLDFAAGQGFRTEALKYTSLKIGDGLAGQAAQERQIVHIANLARLEDNPNLARSIVNEEFVSYFGVPLIAKNKLHGVMEIFNRSALAPDPNWLRFLETLAGQAAISIDNARLLEMTMESLKESNALNRINQDMASTMDPAQLMDNVVNLLQVGFGYY